MTTGEGGRLERRGRSSLPSYLNSEKKKSGELQNGGKGGKEKEEDAQVCHHLFSLPLFLFGGRGESRGGEKGKRGADRDCALLSSRPIVLAWEWKKERGGGNERQGEKGKGEAAAFTPPFFACPRAGEKEGGGRVDGGEGRRGKKKRKRVGESRYHLFMASLLPSRSPAVPKGKRGAALNSYASLQVWRARNEETGKERKHTGGKKKRREKKKKRGGRAPARPFPLCICFPFLYTQTNDGRARKDYEKEKKRKKKKACSMGPETRQHEAHEGGGGKRNAGEEERKKGKKEQRTGMSMIPQIVPFLRREGRREVTEASSINPLCHREKKLEEKGRGGGGIASRLSLPFYVLITHTLGKKRLGGGEGG